MMRIVIALLLCLPLFSVAQQSVERGDIYYEFFQYREAIREYESALKKDRTFKNEAHILTQLAYSYMYTFQYEKAEETFAQLVKLGDNKSLPDVYLDYGNILKILGKYSKAKDQFDYYATLIKSDEYNMMLQRSLAWAERHKDSIRPNTYVGLTNLDISGQCLGYCFFEDGLIYAHAKDTDYQQYTNLFNLDFVQLRDSVTFVEGEDYMNDIKFPFNEGSPTVTADGDIIYFTATAIKVKKGVVRRVGTTEISEDGVSNLKIYTSRFNNGRFSYVQELPFNDKQYNCTHPTISQDGNTLVFASDMPGGFGGLDLYKSMKQPDGTWGKPVNLGEKVNTTENEMFPYMSHGYLYFASKGHVGFGGYDIFQSVLGMNTTPSTPRNLGKPYNSSKDDVAFIIARDGITGYLSSNRDNVEGYDKVYYFNDNYFPARPTAVIAAVTAREPEPAVKPQVAMPQVTTPVPAPVTSLESGKTISTVLFGFNQSKPDQEFFSSLDSLIKLAHVNKNLKLVIHAHADCRGSESYNLALSKRRAVAVKTFLLSKGISAARIGMVMHGEQDPLIICDPCEVCTDEQHRMNRRVEVKVGK